MIELLHYLLVLVTAVVVNFSDKVPAIPYLSFGERDVSSGVYICSMWLLLVNLMMSQGKPMRYYQLLFHTVICQVGMGLSLVAWNYFCVTAALGFYSRLLIAAFVGCVAFYKWIRDLKALEEAAGDNRPRSSRRASGLQDRNEFLTREEFINSPMRVFRSIMRFREHKRYRKPPRLRTHPPVRPRFTIF
ncbi:hypothetical protein KR093_006707 [Drosophila rubida]|uniref:XK-related protein n=1 Tax=Drosophila rubida TaxID=30044 RepID=A0AAD4JRA7_9MUSC|nr:hypothetical protein KR093_006707 [Drosophila rubida]